MIQVILNALAIPTFCKLERPVFKKFFLESNNLDASDKKIIRDDVKKITWLYALKPSNINIPKYEDGVVDYSEIAILQIDLLSENKAKKLNNILNKAIPYPLVALFAFDDKCAIGLANKRINQIDKSKSLIEKEWLTRFFEKDKMGEIEQDFLQDCSIKNLSSLNFYKLYQDLVAKVAALGLAEKTGIYLVTNFLKSEAGINSLREMQEIEQKILNLRNSLSKETQFNRKLELNVEIKNCQSAIDEISKKFYK
ncbi:MAG: DUF4391 domain-containing protein [Pseudomonadota bacterium]